MKKQHMNRNVIVRTCRLCLPAACLSLLAACAAKPIEQDLAAGEATVEIKYLDGVTMDIVDETRTMRRAFYDDALKNRKKEYSQGIQGAVDRVSTIAAAINANAQRDKSVLDRYHADGDRQLSALENSEELGDELLEHNKKLISQTNELNEAKVNAAESQAETLAELNKVKVDAAKTLIEQYKQDYELAEQNVASLEEKLENYKKEKKELEDQKDEPDSPSGLDEKIKNVEKKITALEGEEGAGGKIATAKTKLDTINGNIKNLFFGSAGTVSGSTELLASTTDSSSGKTTGLSVSKGDVTDSLSGVGFKEVSYTEDADGKIVADGTNGKKVITKEVVISQHPQANAPSDVTYLDKALKSTEGAIDAMQKLANSNRDTAVNIAEKLKSPPIERIRNDEAVFDYLIDGYRNTQVSSGAEYGGMVRRVLPFSFTFTPGKNTQSGFAARVLLKPDQQQIDEAAAMIAPHLNAVMQDKVTAYAQQYQQAEETAGLGDTLAGSLLLLDWNKTCSDIKVEGEIKNAIDLFYTQFKNALEKKNMGVPVEPEFWKAYSASLYAVREALNDNSVSAKDGYVFDMSGVKENIKNVIKNELKGKTSPDSTGEPRSILELRMDNFSDYMRSALNETCQLDAQINKISKNNLFDSLKKDKETLKSLFQKIDILIIEMTSAALASNLYLKSNPVFSGDDKTTIRVTPDGVRYKASFEEIKFGDIQDVVNNAAGLRIVQNTSREHVVEIPDTAKMNTFLSAALTGNDVSQQLGLSAGGELAAAISSSSAFMKRLPYAVPFTGQTLSLSGGSQNKEQNQAFGWRFYKTPSGVKQMGGIAQSFKTTPVNSAVVVSMPEWISKLEATYELSEDGGSTWRRVGSEKITLAGASLRGALSSGPSSFDTWAKYHLYREVDGEAGMPKLKSCYGSGNVIYGSSKGVTALCGENLYGVKAVLIGGRYIDEIEKVSSSLIKVNKIGLGPKDCPLSPDSNGKCGNQCEVILLSDFGATRNDNNEQYCLEFQYEKEDVKTPEESTIPPATAQYETNDTNLILNNINYDNLDRIMYYRFNDGPENSWPQSNTISVLRKSLIDICLEKRDKPCVIDMHVRLKNRQGMVPFYKINMDDAGLWKRFPSAQPVLKYTCLGDSCTFTIEVSDYNPAFEPINVLFGNKRTSAGNLLKKSNGEKYVFTKSKAEIENFCIGSEGGQCNVIVKYSNADDDIIPVNSPIDMTELD